MSLTRTLRIDLLTVTQDQVLEFVKSNENLFEKAILYYEIADVTKKPHVQGWIQFVNTENVNTWSKTKFRNFKKAHGLDGAATSCVPVKKETYFSYCAKDKNCIYSFGVSAEERIINEVKSYKPAEKKLKPWEAIESRMRELQVPHVDDMWIKRELLREYVRRRRPIYAATFKAEVALLMSIRGYEQEALFTSTIEVDNTLKFLGL